MGKVCVGGLADGRPADSYEDAEFCVRNEGHVVSRDSGGCGMSAFTPQAMRRPLGAGDLAVMNSLVLLPIRLVRDSLRGSPLVSGLELVNEGLAKSLVCAAAKDEALGALLTDVLFDVASLAGAMLECQHTKPGHTDRFYFTESTHDKISKLAKMLKGELSDSFHGSAVRAVVNGLKKFVGKDAREIYDALRKDIDPAAEEAGEVGTEDSIGDRGAIAFRKPSALLKDGATFTSRFPGGLDAIVSEGDFVALTKPKLSFTDAVSQPALIDELQTLLADRKIEDRAKALGGLGGSASETVPIAPGQYLHSYRDADVYFSQITGVHEVHGDIRAKYNALGGARSILGLPTTDEQGTPDGVGRYNHFQKGSIYWKPNLGPMMLHTALRDLWAAQGWERGFLGYPVADQHSKVFLNPAAQPQAYWEFFENGALFASNFEALPALIAELSPGDLASIIRKFFDDSFHEADSDLGIQGGIKILGVSDYGFGFWTSVPRRITYEIDGFHKNPVISDTTFNLQLTFEFGLSWPPSFTEPAFKTVTISLIHLHIHTSGVGHGELLDKMQAGILDKFKTPFRMTDIPVMDAKFIGLQLTKGGGLQFLLEPTLGNPGFTLNRFLFQNELNKLIPE